MKKFALALAITVIVCLALTVDNSLARSTQSSLTSELGIAPYTPPGVAPMSFQDQNMTIGRFCFRCHNDSSLTAGLTLESFDAAEAYDNAELAEKMIRKLRAHQMPPRQAQQPDDETRMALVAALETTIDTAAAADPNPGHRTFQRLNQAEYAASVRDLLGIDVDVSTFLPPDTISAGFDNIADVQMPSATVMEGYLRAAGQVSRLAVGDPHAEPSSITYNVPRTQSQKEHVEGAPIGTRGGMAVDHVFPADGSYEFQILLHGEPTGALFGRPMRGEKIEVSIDGERAALVEIDRWMSESDPAGLTITTDPVHIRAGTRRVAVAFLVHDEGPEDDLITPVDQTLADTQIGVGYGVTTLPHLRDFAIVGPFEVTGISDNQTRRRIFTCRPTAPDEEEPCARSIIAGLAEHAYRRPLNDADLDGLMAFYNQGAAFGGFEGGITTGLQAILASPHFLFRMEEVPDGVAAGATYRITDADLASRLSFFIWGTPPDDELIELAGRGELSDDAVFEAQVRRMLADPRSEALATRFAAQWLRLQDLDKVDPDALSYPYFDEILSQAMHRETELLFNYIVREDRPVTELLTADYTFVNERLARHYGIPDVTGPEFRKVTYVDDRRRGVLGQGSVLVMTSHGNRTSPVKRGLWVLEVLLGTPPPPPPPNVPDLEETGDAEDGRFKSVAEQMAEHRANPFCSSCHNVMDPIGLALDNFDVTGAWRIKDRGVPIDPSGQLFDGTMLNGPADLRDALLKRSDVVITHFTESLMAYALGRRTEYYDMPTVRRIVRQAEQNDYRISSFILGVAESPAFRTAQVEPTDPVDAEGQ